MDKLVFDESRKAVAYATESGSADYIRGLVVFHGCVGSGAPGLPESSMREAFALYRLHTGQPEPRAQTWIPFDPTNQPPPGDYWCEVPALKLRDGGCLCRALYWSGERWEGPGGEYEVSRFVPEMLPQLHGRGVVNQMDEGRDQWKLDAAIARISELEAELYAERKASDMLIDTYRQEKARVADLESERDNLASRISELATERDSLREKVYGLEVIQQSYAESTETLRKTEAKLRATIDHNLPYTELLRQQVIGLEKDLQRSACDYERQIAAERVKCESMTLRICELETEVGKTNKLFDLVSAERNTLVRDKNELERKYSHRWARIDQLDAALSENQRLRRENDELVAKRNEALARAVEAERHKGRREDQIHVLVTQVTDAQKERDDATKQLGLLSSERESMELRIKRLSAELAKPEDVRLREVLDALEGRAVIFDGLGARVGHLLDEMDEWIARAGEAERMVEAARRSLSSVAEAMTEHAYQELASALESPPRIAVVVPVEVHKHGWQWRPTATDTAFAPPFGTIRKCRVCGCLVAGGPTACARCAEAGS